jgi:hypothetical protein
MIPEELVRRVRDGVGVPLIGSGISRPSGVASWDELIGHLRSTVSEWIGAPIDDRDLDLLEAPRLYTHLNESRQPLYDVLDEAVGASRYEPNILHQLLADLPVRTVLTTNWDTLIEDAVREKRPVNCIYADAHVAAYRERAAVQVVKFHGSIVAHDSIVFGEEDYHRFYGGSSLLLGLVRTILATRSVFALGFGMRDSYVKLLFGEMSQLAHGTGNPHYVIVPEASGKPHAEYLRAAGFVVVPVPVAADDPYGAAGFLRELHERTYSYAADRLTRTRMLLRETERLSRYLGPDRIVRVRATMGPFAVPDHDVFGDPDVHRVELELRDLCLRLARDHRVIFRLIGSPHNAQFVTGKGYEESEWQARYDAHAAAAEEMGDRLQFVEARRASDINTWIVSDLALIESQKSDPVDTRLYSQATLTTDTDTVRRATRWFDDEHNALASLHAGSM